MLRSRVAVWQVNWCYVAGHDLLRRRSWCAVRQVGFSGEDLRHYMLYSSDFRRRSPAKNRTCDTRWGDQRCQMGNQHYRSGRPATPNGETCDTRWETSITRGGDLRRQMGNQHYRSGRPATKSVFPSPAAPAPFPLPPPPPLLPASPSSPAPAPPGSASETLRNTLIY